MNAHTHSSNYFVGKKLEYVHTCIRFKNKIALIDISRKAKQQIYSNICINIIQWHSQLKIYLHFLNFFKTLLCVELAHLVYQLSKLSFMLWSSRFASIYGRLGFEISQPLQTWAVTKDNSEFALINYEKVFLQLLDDQVLICNELS